MIRTVLVANRGEIALRIVRACRERGLRSVVAYSTEDAGSLPVRLADEAVCVGPAPAARSYLNAAALIQTALLTGADAVHPGYGFLSEDRDFAELCAAHGLTFVGPAPRLLSRLSDKAEARRVLAAAGLPLLPGSERATADLAEAERDAHAAGFPVIVKAVAGGGGLGMEVAGYAEEFADVFARTRARAQTLYSDGRLYVERYCVRARHIEVQILGDGQGGAVHLGTRDCSVQRRHQKLIEESPPLGLPPGMAEKMAEAAAHAAAEIGYSGAGTFEFLVDDAGYYFMEANCRIQVEHPVTEMVYGVDLVQEQLAVAAGEPLGLRQVDLAPRGAAVECRVNAEDPQRGFLPTPGVLTAFAPPAGPFVRVDTHCAPGQRVSPAYDSLLAKVVVWAQDRERALARMRRALDEFEVAGDGMATTLGFLRGVLDHGTFVAGRHTTAFVQETWGDGPGPAEA